MIEGKIQHWFLLLLFQMTISLALAQNLNFSAGLWKSMRFEDIAGHTLSYSDLKTIFDQIDFYDYVRTNDQKEEIIEYLLGQCEKQHYYLGMAKCSNILGVIARDRSEYAKAIELHERALSFPGIDTITTIFSLNNLGVVYRRLDKPRLALDFHIQALNLAEKFHSDPEIRNRSISVSLNSIGNINLALNQPGKALEVFSRSLGMEKENNNDLGIAINLQNIGLSFEMMEKTDTALACYKESLAYNQKIGSVVGLAICNNSIGAIHLSKQQPLVALAYFEEALDLSEKTQDHYYISQSHANLGKAFLNLGQMDKALVHLEKFEVLARMIQSGLQIKESQMLLSEYYEKIEDFKKAFEYYKIGNMVNDSIINEKNTRYLNELQTLYEAQKREQQINLLTARNRIKNQQAIIAFIGLSMMGLIVVFLIFFLQKRASMNRCELEHKLFRSQMNPHFIFNALGSIQSFMYKNEPQKAAEYLGLYSHLTRSVLQNSNNELITLEEELDTLKKYIEIEKMRLQGNFSYTITVDPEAEPDFTYVPPIILQPFVENAIHHGLKNLSGRPGVLTINVFPVGNLINVEIIDNGPGIHHIKKEEKIPGHESMGLKIFQQRIQLFKRKYKKNITFVVSDLGDGPSEKTGTRIEIGFPLIHPND